MKISRVVFAALLVSISAARAETKAPPEALRSPTNQVFQWVQSSQSPPWADGSVTNATAYLWIPEKCRRLRGLLILCANVPEHMLVGHPAIRRVCAENNLGIFWGTQSFYNFKTKNENANHVAFLQKLLDGLAQTSGYDEVARVPWLPMGESGHLLMVDALVEAAPQRCIAGIWIKNNHWSKNRDVPALVAYGTAQEWSQDKSDIRKSWNNVGGAYDGVLNQRKAHPNWPLSYVIDGHSGHFDCSERLTQYFAKYIGDVCKARLGDGETLKPIDLSQGYLADLPVPGHENGALQEYAKASPEARAVPWYFTREAAAEAQAIARINWKAQTQLPAFTDENGNVFPFSFNGITWLPIHTRSGTSWKPDGADKVPSPLLQTEADGITFSLRGTLLEKLPENFVGAGEKLAQAPGNPSVEWLCGGVEPAGDGKFRMALDRTWPSPIYVAVRHAGAEGIRGIVQPGQISRETHQGAPQKITFEKLPEVPIGTPSLPLKAVADSGLPVRYFVVSGPATVQGETLVFTEIPPRAKLPITVTVAAWQWGRSVEPKIKTAEIVRQSFAIVAR